MPASDCDLKGDSVLRDQSLGRVHVQRVGGRPRVGSAVVDAHSIRVGDQRTCI